ncbi:hypothetical protein ALC57_11286 [Trachymyrmex cornetzi]|uniref:Uncharacterized protein n=1 Tax=Trachymyrmex cornetzi TaxID=471704 RepID=A0A195DU84_9HYME|nr:hypothetical protein ALC57_11286 [Trachymyrmex cornetzi]
MVKGGERERDRHRNSSCVEGLAFVRWAAFNPVADSGLGIWTLGCIRKREREDESLRESERARARKGRGPAHAANRLEQRALARDVLVVCVAPHSLAVTLAARTLRRERASVVLL